MPYRSAWQTWRVVTPGEHRPSQPAQATQGQTNGDFRSLMQTARVQKRLSIAELAARVRCDANVIADFERGEGVIDDQLRNAIKRELAIPRESQVFFARP